MGGTLGTRWAKAGHEVAFSSRNPESADMKALANNAGPSARAATVSDAVRGSDVIVIATPWPATKLAMAAAGNLTGKLIIDATNPLLPDLSGLDQPEGISAAEQIATLAPGAKVVKAFNTVGSNLMADPQFGAARSVLFYAGDDSASKQTVHQLADELGFDPVDAGPLPQARVLESFALLWISLAFGGYGRDIGFSFLRR